MGQLGSAIEAVNVIGSNFYGPILGVFFLAIFTRRTTSNGAFVGIVIAIISVQLTSQFTEISYLYYNLVGSVVSVVSGYTFSCVSSVYRRCW